MGFPPFLSTATRAASTPLLSRCADWITLRLHRFENVEDVGLHGEISEATVVAEGEERTTVFVWLLVLCASISGLLFGVYLFSYGATQPYR